MENSQKIKNKTPRRKHSMLFNIGLSNIFLDMFPQAKETKAKLNGTTSNQKASAQQRKSTTTTTTTKNHTKIIC